AQATLSDEWRLIAIPCFISAVLGAQLSLYQTQRFLFVEISTAQLHCRTLEEEVGAMWYKEQSASLQWIYWSSEFASADGKYSSKANTAANRFSLIISNVQREDSGVYYCGLISFIYLQPNFGNGTRLIVTGDWGSDRGRETFIVVFVCSRIPAQGLSTPSFRGASGTAPCKLSLSKSMCLSQAFQIHQLHLFGT
uniref:Ig-like domain-containing protein n=1 Tax=Chelydra serpentina TaxID=8475 RepID=A0A8C3XU27_CHESE